MDIIIGCCEIIHVKNGAQYILAIIIIIMIISKLINDENFNPKENREKCQRWLSSFLIGLIDMSVFCLELLLLSSH